MYCVRRKSISARFRLYETNCYISGGAPVHGRGAAQKTPATADSQFVQKASAGGMAEVKLGELAKQKGTSSAVKDFGSRMVTDHTQGNDKLKSIAMGEGMSVATALESKDQALYDRLSSMSGAQFDEAYIDAMVKDHREDIAEFEEEAKNGENAKIKQFAMDTLPTLRDHLKMAETASSELKKNSPGKVSRTKPAGGRFATAASHLRRAAAPARAVARYRTTTDREEIRNSAEQRRKTRLRLRDLVLFWRCCAFNPPAKEGVFLFLPFRLA
jgi:putative membrane protein